MSYDPKHLKQLGWGTKYDNENCAMTSTAMFLDAETLGKKTSTPPEMRKRSKVTEERGTNIQESAIALATYGVHPLMMDNGTWDTFVKRMGEGRSAHITGDYQYIPNSYSCQPNFDGSHGMFVTTSRGSGSAREWLVHDPLCSAAKWIPETYLKAYATHFHADKTFDAYFTSVHSNPTPSTTGEPMITGDGIDRKSSKLVSLKQGTKVTKTPGGAPLTEIAKDGDYDYFGTSPSGRMAIEVETRQGFTDGKLHKVIAYVEKDAGPIKDAPIPPTIPGDPELQKKLDEALALVALTKTELASVNLKVEKARADLA